VAGGPRVCDRHLTPPIVPRAEATGAASEEALGAVRARIAGAEKKIFAKFSKAVGVVDAVYVYLR
jgi:hypothetical protein